MENEDRKEHHGHHHDEHHEEHRELFIHIDHKKYEPPKHEMTGNEIRVLAVPPIAQEFNLWLETPGPGDDDIIGDTQCVHLRHGMSFYSALKQINPGASDATA